MWFILNIRITHPISIRAGMPVNALRHITAAHDADFFYGAKVPKRVPDNLSLLSAATIQKDRVAKLHTMRYSFISSLMGPQSRIGNKCLLIFPLWTAPRS